MKLPKKFLRSRKLPDNVIDEVFFFRVCERRLDLGAIFRSLFDSRR